MSGNKHSGDRVMKAEAHEQTLEEGLGGLSAGQAQSGQVDLATVRARLAGKRGPEYWRSLEELAETPEFEAMLHREFPRFASEWPQGVDRRRFLQLMGASVALGGLTACTRQPLEKIVPYVEQPRGLVPGRSQFFATGFEHAGAAAGVLAESHEGRPTKIEGNPQHPSSLGGSDLFAQASVLELYDPDRSQVVRHIGRIGTWEQFFDDLGATLTEAEGNGGAGIRLLTESISSPTLRDQIDRFRARFPRARWVTWDAATRDFERQGLATAFGAALAPRYDLRRADVVLTLDSDFLTQGPGAVRYARDFADRRRPAVGHGETAGAGHAEPEAAEQQEMSRLYAVESTPTGTGTLADHRLSVPPRQVALAALELARHVGVSGIAASPPPASERDVRVREWATQAAADLARHRGRCLVVAGEATAPEVHALAAAMNSRLGAVGSTVTYAERGADGGTGQFDDLTRLVADMRSGKVETLFILGGNPVFDAPADLAFREAQFQVPLRIRMGLYEDETSEVCHWHLPLSHYLESWGDARAHDGTATLIQPLIEPLYDTRSALEVVAALTDGGAAAAGDGRQLLADYWANRIPVGTEAGRFRPEEQAAGTEAGRFRPEEQAAGTGAGRPANDTEAAGLRAGRPARPNADPWRQSLHDGFIAGTAPPPVTPSLDAAAVRQAAARLLAGQRERPRLALSFRPDSTVWDGRFANLGWLQECPKQITKLTWDNALLVSPATARALGIETEHMVRVSAGERSVELPVWVLPGQADDHLTVHLGGGRRRCGRVGDGVGFDVYPLRTTAAPWTVEGVTVAPTGKRHELVSTQLHHNMALETQEAAERHILRVGTLAELRQHPDLIHEMGHQPDAEMTLYKNEDHPYNGHAWALAVDLNACTGCNACVIACQAENNIPVVGKEQVALGREMQWIRIDRYYQGDLADPRIHSQPVLCMHCENAPCEVVCPVGATVHSDEGLNDMVYNRCVGTRYCANNCPYKVRRFNFFLYSDYETPVLKLLRNPDVTVRSRGVMEKCTYCVQRIEQGKIDAQVAERELADGDIVTACQQACPSRAIAFGDKNDPESEISHWRGGARNYAMLADLNTRPRTTYLAKITNPNPRLGES